MVDSFLYMSTKGPALAQPLRRLIAARLGQGLFHCPRSRMRRSMALAEQLHWRSVCIWMAHNTHAGPSEGRL